MLARNISLNSTKKKVKKKGRKRKVEIRNSENSG